MGRRKKGRDVSGWLVIDKPAGPTSTQVVGKVRWALDAKKAGHSGTLDPDATGLLAVALGEATKTIPFVTDALKAYRFAVRFGQSTRTDDAEGDVVNASDLRPTDDEITQALGAFVGDIEQVPPQFSAVKVEGERAHALARQGEALDLAPRPLYVESLQLIARPDEDHAELEMVCGKGGYVRSIARDLGEQLGCYAHVRWLRRTWSGPFTLDGAVPLDEVEKLARTPDLDALLLPVDAGLADLPRAACSQVAAARIKNGNPAQVISTDAEFGETALVTCQGAPIAIGTYRAGEIHPTRVFNLPDD